MEAHGWPTIRKSYLDLYIKEGQPPPATRANLLEWIKVSPVTTFPVGYTANVAPIATRLVGEMNSASAPYGTPPPAGPRDHGRPGQVTAVAC